MIQGLKDLRSEHGLTQEQMSIRLGVSLSYYKRIEQGAVKPSYRVLELIKDNFNQVNIDTVFFTKNQYMDPD